MTVDIIHNVNAERNHNGELVKDLLYQQVTKPVLWTTSVRHAKNDGSTHFVEIGAGRVLTGLVKKIDPTIHPLNIDTVENLKKTMDALNA